MWKKHIAVLIVVSQLISAGTVFSMPLNLRTASVVDYLQSTNNFYAYDSVQCGAGAYATQIPAHMVYKVFSIDTVMLFVSGGAIETDFSVSVSADGIIYNPIKSTMQFSDVVYENRTQTIYQFKGLIKEQQYLKIELLSKDVVINRVNINDASTDPFLAALFEGVQDTAGGQTITKKEMAAFKSIYLENLKSNSNVIPLLEGIREDGSWSDISYNGDNGSVAEVHCERIEKIARCIFNPKSSLFKDEKAIQKVALALDFWVGQNIQFKNWYPNRIRVPQYIGNTLLAVGDLLPKATEEMVMEYLTFKIVNVIEGGNDDVGQNALEMNSNRIFYALYTDDLQRLQSALTRISKEVTVVNKLGPGNEWRDRMWTGYVKVPNLPDTKEGIQVDYSSLFHGPLIYSGGYGLTFINKVTDLISLTNGTNVFPKEGLADLIDQVLEHYAYITRGTTIDYNTIGRHVANTNGLAAANNGRGLFATIKKLSELENVPRKDELVALYQASTEEAEPILGDIENYTVKTIHASAAAQDENIPENLIDNNLRTTFSLEGKDSYFICDLGEEKPLGVVAIGYHMGSKRKSIIKIETSVDNESWISVYDGMSSGASEDLDFYFFKKHPARYVKITGYGNTVNSWNSLKEIMLFETIDMQQAEKNQLGLEFVEETGDAKLYYLVDNRGTKPPKPAVTGHKYYWKADYTAHPKQKYLLGLRTSSNRTLTTEVVSTVNLKGDFLADGSTYIYRTGDEYDDIFGAWDWCKIPGTTSQLREFTPLMIQHNVVAGSNSDYAGGVSDGVNGATAMQLVRDGVSAKKAWFMFDDEFVALGSDMKNTSENEMVTTVNQSLLKGAVTVGRLGDTTQVLEQGTHPKENILWAHHDNIGYLFNEGTTASIENKAVQGDRVDINYGGFLYRPNRTDLVTKNIFTLWLNHTANKTDTYAYTVVPQVSVEGLKAYAQNNPIDIISNSSTLQAVAHKGLDAVQAVFWTPGSVTTRDGTTITVDGQVLIQVVKKENKAVVSIASLNAASGTINVQISGSLSGNNAQEMAGGISAFSVNLPSGDYAGQSVVLEFDIVE